MVELQLDLGLPTGSGLNATTKHEPQRGNQKFTLRITVDVAGRSPWGRSVYLFVFTTTRLPGFLLIGLQREHLFVHTAVFTSCQAEGEEKTQEHSGGGGRRYWSSKAVARTDSTAIKPTRESLCMRGISHVGFLRDGTSKAIMK